VETFHWKININTFSWTDQYFTSYMWVLTRPSEIVLRPLL